MAKSKRTNRRPSTRETSNSPMEEAQIRKRSPTSNPKQTSTRKVILKRDQTESGLLKEQDVKVHN